MKRRVMAACVFVVAVSTGVEAENIEAKIVLKDASNADRIVGPSPQDGIPAGHTLKIAIPNARGARRLAGAGVTVTVRHGRTVAAEQSGELGEFAEALRGSRP